MRTFKKILFLFSTILTCFFISQMALAKKGSEKIVIKTTIYCDHCNECESCGQFLNKEIKYLKGVKFAKLDVIEMTFTIEYNTSKTNPAELRAAISKLGYDADEVKADPTAYQKLDGCCKKSE